MDVVPTPAFDDWKAAHDAYIAAERRLADAQTVFAFTHKGDPEALRAEVDRRREEADRLFRSAMDAAQARH